MQSRVDQSIDMQLNYLGMYSNDRGFNVLRMDSGNPEPMGLPEAGVDANMVIEYKEQGRKDVITKCHENP